MNEIQVGFAANRTLDYLIRNQAAQPWSTSGGTGGFENYATANYADYAISMTEQGTASAYYVGSVPAALPPGVYNVEAKVRAAGSPLETDQRVGVGELQWDGASPIGLAGLASSGQLGQFLPVRLARGVMVLNFPFKLVSDSDNKTPFTSGVVSGQISRDGGAFGPLQSGAFSEVGLGHYSLAALTSGDLNANSVSLVLTANGVSGGRAAQRDFAFLTQRVSGG